MVDSKKGSNFALEIRNTVFLVQEMHMKLGYGVMVTLQILVLPFLVRVRIPQQKAKSQQRFGLFSFKAATRLAPSCHASRTMPASRPYRQHLVHIHYGTDTQFLRYCPELSLELPKHLVAHPLRPLFHMAHRLCTVPAAGRDVPHRRPWRQNGQ